MPAEIDLFRFHDWNDYKSNFAIHLPNRDAAEVVSGRYIFRGQRNRDWGLITSFDRRYPECDLKFRNRDFRKWMRWFFHELSREYKNDYKADDPRLAALAQHYGLPTRLLDWTYSPYIAAYFALAEHLLSPGRMLHEDAVVWAINVDAFEQAVPTRDAEIVTVTDVGNVRLRNQDGLFIYLKANDTSLDALIERKGELAMSSIKKLVLPSKDVRTAIEDMFLMGITPRTIYPGFSGIAEHVLIKSFFER